MRRLPLVVTFAVNERGRSVVSEALMGVTDVIFLTDVELSERADVLSRAGALLVINTMTELRQNELPLIRKTLLIQFITAGIDFIPLHDLPDDIPLASNGGAYAEPMAEHALAMVLAAAKRLFVEHQNLSRGQFNQFTLNKTLAGGVCGVFGFGGVGMATARLMRCLGMHIHAINYRGATREPVDSIGTPDRLPALLAASDVFVISVPLTHATEGAIGARELSLMKEDATLVNLARGEIVNERALYEHLQANPRFTACIDAWWVEPVRHGEFQMRQPFLQLPNVIGSPHNSASIAGSQEIGLRCAVSNCMRALKGETPLHLIRPDERMR